ncbi:hypothetical protein CLOACE_04450 [Clostridium acetireducens DSM 10703]|jgi:rubrerythrin|uniref:Uncharacterized protein n=1 Tax=Clostridium acetireducens DSM 10703 TaxID=1121290 RepID=A0A1E8F1M6_9CLOT|nr:hypothetical protein [Clostridium acetireducens]OFI07252.1 hypothetical protein CLOACE_04450 [Clostridium acetireducens DSM 10703]
MHLTTVDMIKKKILDAQENVRDYQMFSKRVESKELDAVFKDFSEQSAMQASKLKELLDKYER